MINRKHLLYKSYFIGLILFIITIIIIIKLIYIQISPKSKYYESFAKKNTIRFNSVKARRGDIYDFNGNLLATSVTRYNIYIDFKSIPKKIFYKNLNELCFSLEKVSNKSRFFLKKVLKKEKQKNNRYFLLMKNIDFLILKKLRNFSIFNKKKINCGFIVEQTILRIHPLEKFGKRIIGYDDHRGKVGLEGAFSKFLKGEDGKRLEQRINNNYWKPIKNWNNVDPKEGKDLYLTIDINKQDLIYNILLNKLIISNASHGCAVLMEVNTGEIHAIVNLKKVKNNIYKDLQNFAVWETSEPGSTFKSIALLAAIEDNKINSNTLFDINDQDFFKKHKIRDSHNINLNSKLINVKKILEISSNLGMATLIYKGYKNTPNEFINHLYKWKLNKKLDLDIPGEGIPFIPNPNEKFWNNYTLPWMSFGYSLKLTPLQILSFYNAIANNGIFIKPCFIKKIKNQNNILKFKKTYIINQLIASKKSLKKIQYMLEGVVKNGTAKKIYHPKYPYAGKTGTTQLEYWIKDKPISYNSSFVGYFPAKKPKYSCIVVISKPKNGYYGSEIAAPIFDEIAQGIYPYIYKKNILKIKNYNFNKSSKIKFLYKKIFYRNKKMSNIIGFAGKDIIPELENMGLIVSYKGIGKVNYQSIKPGEIFKKGQTILIHLE